MKEKKYRDDWVTEVSLDEKTGRERRIPVYQGEWIEMTTQEKRNTLFRTGLGLGLFLACWIFFCAVDFSGTRVLYVFLPLGCAVFPAVYWMMGEVALIKTRQRMTRLQREKSLGRIHRSAIGAALLSGAAVLGELIWIMKIEDASWEIGGLMILIIALAAALFSAKTEKRKS